VVILVAAIVLITLAIRHSPAGKAGAAKPGAAWVSAISVHRVTAN
jgi:hypothetical protein